MSIYARMHACFVSEDDEVQPYENGDMTGFKIVAGRTDILVSANIKDGQVVRNLARQLRQRADEIEARLPTTPEA